MFSWTPKTLKCQIYENGILLDLKSCTDAELQELIDCIFPLWKTSTQSALWFDIDVYEKHHLFKEKTITMEVACFTLNPDSFPARKQVSISAVKYDKMVGRKFSIQPKNTLCHKWKYPVEVAFVA